MLDYNMQALPDMGWAVLLLQAKFPDCPATLPKIFGSTAVHNK